MLPHFNLLRHVFLFDLYFFARLINVLVDLQVSFNYYHFGVVCLVMLVDVVNQVEIKLILQSSNLDFFYSPLRHQNVVLPVHVRVQMHVQVFHLAIVYRIF